MQFLSSINPFHSANYPKESIPSPNKNSSHTEKQKIFISPNNVSLWNIFKAAIETGGPSEKFQEKQGVIFARALIAGSVSAVALLPLIAGSIALIAIPIITNVGVTLLTYRVEKRRANECLNSMALKFKTNDRLPHAVSQHILRNESVFEQFITDKKHLTNRDNKDMTFWEEAMRPDRHQRIPLKVFTKLRDELFPENDQQLTDEQYENFKTALKSNQTIFIISLLGCVSKEKFTDVQRTGLWPCAANNIKTVKLLKDFGFDINEQDCDEYTPLFRVLDPKNPSFNGYSYRFINTMLQEGARDASREFYSKDKRPETKSVKDFIPTNFKQTLKLLDNENFKNPKAESTAESETY